MDFLEKIFNEPKLRNLILSVILLIFCLLGFGGYLFVFFERVLFLAFTVVAFKATHDAYTVFKKEEEEES